MSNITPEVKKLHDEAIIIDGHCDTIISVRDGQLKFAERHTPRQDGDDTPGRSRHIDIPRMREGGITTQVFACFTREQFLPSYATHEALRMIDAFHQIAADNPKTFGWVTRAADIERIKKEGITGGMLSLEGVESLEGDLAVLRMFYSLGIRQVGLTWNWRNQAADGLYEARTGGGLTEFGVKLIEEANRLGVIIDVAHLAPAGIRDVFALSKQPIVDSHCGARGVTDHERNLDDGQLDALAKNGGVACVTYVPPFVNTDDKNASIKDVIDHIEYIAKRIGVEHVALGSDFDGYSEPLHGMNDIADLPNMTAGLVERGFKPDEVKKILGGNYLRVIKAVVG